MPREWMLCLDASAPRTCVALGFVDGPRDELVVADEREDRASQCSEQLHLRLAAALAAAELRPRELAMIAGGRGPGTFTGSRVAVATVKGLALGLGCPVIPVSTLASLAASSAVDGPTLALLDARRDQVYAGMFEVGAHIEARSSERVATLADVIAELELAGLFEQLRAGGARITALGPGCGPYADQLPELLRAHANTTPGPTARGLWRAAVSGWRSGAAIEASEFTVSYLRQSYAEMGITTPKRAAYKSPFV